LFKIEVKKIILFVPMTGKKLINRHILKNSFCKIKFINFGINIHS
jgi:hypothetical protein